MSFLVVEGINHLRLVGICKSNDIAFDFDKMNIGGYREPITEKEIEECKKVARQYYNACIDSVRTGKLGYEQYKG